MDLIDNVRRRFSVRRAFPASPVLILLCFAILPFFLSTGLDLDAVQRQAVLQLYREWRWQSEAKNLRPNATLIFDRQREKSELEEYFKVQLQRDFKLQDIGDFPRVRIFFARDSFLHGRVEIIKPGQVTPDSAWEGKVRFINNGILMGAFVGVLLYFLRKGFRVIAWSASLVMLWWYVDWNLLDVPGHVVQSTISLVQEVYYRFLFHDWVASEMGRLAGLGAFVWLLLLIVVFKVFVRNPGPKTVRNTLIFSLLSEPFFVWASSQFAQWGPNASWWKVYLGSFLFRFVTFSFLLILYFRPTLLNFEPPRRRKLKVTAFPVSVLFLSYVFLISGGWGWLNSVLSAETSNTLLKLKIFFVASILSFTIGSRIFSLWLGTLALAIILPPARGYWASSIWFGFLLDGLLLGWWLSPFKGIRPILNSKEPLVNWMAVVTMAWIAGIFLASVEAPLVLCWTTLVLGVWAFLQVLGPLPEPSDTRAL